MAVAFCTYSLHLFPCSYCLITRKFCYAILGTFSLPSKIPFLSGILYSVRKDLALMRHRLVVQSLQILEISHSVHSVVADTLLVKYSQLSQRSHQHGDSVDSVNARSELYSGVP